MSITRASNRGLGLNGIAERVKILGGIYSINSENRCGNDGFGRSFDGQCRLSSDTNMIEPEITILIADDHPIFRHGLRQIIETDEQLKIIAEAESGGEALKKSAN